jgi:hypothetical protein
MLRQDSRRSKQTCRRPDNGHAKNAMLRGHRRPRPALDNKPWLPKWWLVRPKKSPRMQLPPLTGSGIIANARNY